MLYALGTGPAAAAEQFRFASIGAMTGAAETIVGGLTEFLGPKARCSVHLLIDDNALQLFARGDVEAFNVTLIEAFKKVAFGRNCVYRAHDLTEAGNRLPDAAEENGFVLRMSYYQSSEGVMVFAKLENLAGGYVASSGRVDLEVRPVPEGGGAAIAERAAEREEAEAVAALARAAQQATAMAEAAPAPAPAATLRIEGAGTLGQGLVLDLADHFLRGSGAAERAVRRTGPGHGRAEIRLTQATAGSAPVIAATIRNSSSEAGLQALLRGETDIAMSTRAATAEEKAAFENAFGVDLGAARAEYVIGIAGLEILVNPANRLAYLSRDTLSRIYRGELSSWDAPLLRPSGLDGPISVLGRASGAAAGDHVQALILAGAGGASHPVPADGQALLERLDSDRQGLALHAIRAAAGNRAAAARPALELIECGLLYPPSGFHLRTEDYPLSRRIYLYANPAIDSVLRDRFLAFALSTAPGGGQDIVARHAVDLRLATGDPATTAWRRHALGQQATELTDARRAFYRDLGKARRLSSTFRFRPEATEPVLDSRGERDLEALIDGIRAGEFAAGRLRLYGFADAAGRAAYNLEVAESRALAVAARLEEAGIGIDENQVLGVGEEAPVACNYLPDGENDAEGQARNRRVEVWLAGEG
jgi:phosphate transport system substrate-binding protein